MRDHSEFTYSLSTVYRALQTRWGVLPFGFTEWFRPRKRVLLGETWNAFAACFCTHGDLLSQWRAYTPEASGVAIGFRLSELGTVAGESKDFGLCKINYSPDELQDSVGQICDIALGLNPSSVLTGFEIEQFWSEVALHLLMFSVQFKNPHFEEEKEWRALTLRPMGLPFEKRYRGDAEVKFIRININPDMINHIILGPLVNDRTKAQFRAFLDANGFHGPRLSHSDIPLR